MAGRRTGWPTFAASGRARRRRAISSRRSEEAARISGSGSLHVGAPRGARAARRVGGEPACRARKGPWAAGARGFPSSSSAKAKARASAYAGSGAASASAVRLSTQVPRRLRKAPKVGLRGGRLKSGSCRGPPRLARLAIVRKTTHGPPLTAIAVFH